MHSIRSNKRKTMSKWVWYLLIVTVLLTMIVNLALLPFYLSPNKPKATQSSFTLELFSLTGIDVYQFNPMFLNLLLCPENISFDHFAILHNSELISSKHYFYDERTNSYRIEKKIEQDGLQQIEMIGIDSRDRIFYENVQIWAGSDHLQVTVVDEHAKLVDRVSVNLQLIEDQTTQKTKLTDGQGQVTFDNLPLKNIRIQASTTDNKFVMQTSQGISNENKLQLNGFNNVSLDDGQQLAGWTFTNNTHALLLPVDVGPVEQLINCINVKISTGQGEQHVSRTFQTQPNTRSAKINYRFVNNEPSNMLMNLSSNDYCHITLRSKMGYTRRSILHSLDLFLNTSEWMELSLPLKIEQDIVQIDIIINAISNYSSRLNLQVYPTEVALSVMKFELKKIMQNNSLLTEPLRFISIPLRNFNESSSIKLFGSLVIRGNNGTFIKEVRLELIQKDRQVLTAKLTTVASEQLLNKSFDSDGILSVSDIFLFEFTNEQMIALMNIQRLGSVRFCIRVVSHDNLQITDDHPIPIKLFINFIGNKNQINGNTWSLPGIEQFMHYLNESNEKSVNIYRAYQMSLGAYNNESISHLRNNDANQYSSIAPVN